MKKPIKTVILASGEGSTFQFLQDCQIFQHSPLTLSAVVSERKNAGIILRAQRAGVPFCCVDYQPATTFDQRLSEVVIKFAPDFILCLGFLKKIGPILLSQFPHRIVNTHPSLLPKYGGHGLFGHRVHEAVHTAQEKQSGATLHLVNENYDEGRILMQTTIDVHPQWSAQDIEVAVKEVEKRQLLSFLEKISKNPLDEVLSGQ